MAELDIVSSLVNWSGRRVFVTGHTGFKGGWLSLWLASRGALVHGFALDPPTAPSFFDACRLADHLARDTRGDIRDRVSLRRALCLAKPEVVFHLAAQPLVRLSYREPVDTFEVNVMGTVGLLDAVRSCGTVQAVVAITTDKVYENREWDWAYREAEPLGGADPYSASKACAELVCGAYRRSYLMASGVRLATARAGNVIGGGDWAADRLVPDFLRAADSGETLNVRSPKAVRPWQHVLEPLSGYLQLADRLLVDDSVADAWNFGPDDSDSHTVGWIADHLCRLIPGTHWNRDRDGHPHEAGQLAVDSTKARRRLGWRPRWRLDEALERTVAWHARWRDGADMTALSLLQITDYEVATERTTNTATDRKQGAA